MKTIVIADIHLNKHNRLDDTEKVLNQIVDYASENAIDELWILGDVYDRARAYNVERNVFHRFIRKIIDIGLNIKILVGNHDLDRQNASTLDEFGELPLEQVELIPNPTVVDTGHHSVYLGHFMVDGAKLGPSDYIATHAKSLKDILKTPAELYCLGDVHKAQKLHTRPDVLYVGSPERIDFGERDEVKGFVVVDSNAHDNIRYTFVPLKTRPMVQIKATTIDGELVMDQVKVKDAIVKVKVTCDKETYKKINETLIKNQLKEAYSVKIEYDIKREERKSRSNISESNTAQDAFTKYAKETKLDKETTDLGLAIIRKQDES